MITEERQHGDITEHKHGEYDYWHSASRVHNESTRDELPTSHVLKSIPLAEKLILDLVGVTPIQKMEIGKSLEIGAVQSLIEGLEHHRYAASTLLEQSFKDFDNGNSAHYGALFYAEWQPNHKDITHRYLIEVSGEDVFVGYFPYDGRKPRLYGIHHKKMDVIRVLHKTNNSAVHIPELTLLTELNIPNISFCLRTNQTDISHKQGTFYTRSIYGEFIPLLSGESMWNPRHPYYIFQGATGYVQLFEGKMFCYPDGSIRFLTIEQEDRRDSSIWTDLTIVQGDVVAYENVPLPEQKDEQNDVWIDRHHIIVDRKETQGAADHTLIQSGENIHVMQDCTLTLAHPEHGETKYEAMKGEMLALMPGTSRPFQKDSGRD
ncbi:MAG: hypothetical protein V1854_04965 [Methanobacteriota archaeon]